MVKKKFQKIDWKNFQDQNFTPFRCPWQTNFTPFRCPRRPNLTPFWCPRQPKWSKIWLSGTPKWSKILLSGTPKWSKISNLKKWKLLFLKILRSNFEEEKNSHKSQWQLNLWSKYWNSCHPPFKSSVFSVQCSRTLHADYRAKITLMTRCSYVALKLSYNSQLKFKKTSKHE